MQLTLLLFGILLISVASVRFEEIHPIVYSGFKHIDAEKISKILVNHHKSKKITSIYRCRYFYCHADYDEVRLNSLYNMTPYESMRLGECNTFCIYLQHHTSYTVMDSWLPKLNSNVPDKGRIECYVKCQLDCTEPNPDECARDCTGLCLNHFYFDNREEYETEFLELMIRLNRFFI